MKYYIADLHFGHENVIRLDNRPFKDINHMNESLIQNWNETISANDEVYILGDLFFRNSIDPIQVLQRLSGKKYLIPGNHDTKLLKNSEALTYFEAIDKIMEIDDNGKRIILCHYPLLEWNHYFRGSYHIYGHIHNNTNANFEWIKKEPRMLNAGCMINGYKPVTFDELVKNNKQFITFNERR